MTILELESEEQRIEAVQVACFFQTVTAQELPDGRQVQIYPLTFGRARIGITTPHQPTGGYTDVW